MIKTTVILKYLTIYYLFEKFKIYTIKFELKFTNYKLKLIDAPSISIFQHPPSHSTDTPPESHSTSS